jgi:DNA invertase Pin-like site-specific DNA recombinase
VRSAAENEEHEEVLRGLADDLRRTPMTAAEVARTYSVTVTTANKRLRALSVRGFEVVEASLPSENGPHPRLYRVV